MFKSVFSKIKKKPLLERLDKPLIFVHVAKTAGTTFQLYLHSLMPSENCIAEPYYNTDKPLAEFFGDCSKRLYIGHVPYSACQKLQVKGYYITFLRQPFARAFSVYSQWKNPANLQALVPLLNAQQLKKAMDIQQMSFQEYVLCEDPWVYREIQNLMSRQLARNSEADLKTAFDVLRKDFYWFGITEEFDKSIQLLNMGLLGQPNSKAGVIVEQNISPKYDNTLDEKGKLRLKELNEYDLRLYEKARALFDERYQKLGIKPNLSKPWAVQDIHFNPPRSEVDFYIRGLSTAEPWGIWSDGSVVTLTFTIPLPPRFKLFLHAKAFGPNAGDKQFVAEVGDSVVSFYLNKEISEQELEFSHTTESKTLVIRIPEPTSPKELGQGEDKRKLGIGFVRLRIMPCGI